MQPNSLQLCDLFTDRQLFYNFWFDWILKFETRVLSHNLVKFLITETYTNQFDSNDNFIATFTGKINKKIFFSFPKDNFLLF